MYGNRWMMQPERLTVWRAAQFSRCLCCPRSLSEARWCSPSQRAPGWTGPPRPRRRRCVPTRSCHWSAGGRASLSNRRYDKICFFGARHIKIVMCMGLAESLSSRQGRRKRWSQSTLMSLMWRSWDRKKCSLPSYWHVNADAARTNKTQNATNARAFKPLRVTTTLYCVIFVVYGKKGHTLKKMRSSVRHRAQYNEKKVTVFTTLKHPRV